VRETIAQGDGVAVAARRTEGENQHNALLIKKMAERIQDARILFVGAERIIITDGGIDGSSPALAAEGSAPHSTILTIAAAGNALRCL